MDVRQDCDSAGSQSTQNGKTFDYHPVESVEADYYEILQLSPNALPDTIHRVYHLLAQRYHPDNQETGDGEQFQILLEAYRVLRDPETRAAYDANLTQTRQLRWKIFDTPAAARGQQAEKRKRGGVLSLLYAQRLNQPDKPGMSIPEVEGLLGCPREHLEFTLWYLREAGCVIRGDNGRFTITIKGVDTVESGEVADPLNKKRLPAAAG